MNLTRCEGAVKLPIPILVDLDQACVVNACYWLESTTLFGSDFLVGMFDLSGGCVVHCDDNAYVKSNLWAPGTCEELAN